MAETPSDFAYAYDLTLDEARRRTAVLEAIEGDWDPVGVLAGEELAAEDQNYRDMRARLLKPERQAA